MTSVLNPNIKRGPLTAEDKAREQAALLEKGMPVGGRTPRDIGLGNGPRGLPPKGMPNMEPAKGLGTPIVKGMPVMQPTIGRNVPQSLSTLDIKKNAAAGQTMTGAGQMLAPGAGQAISNIVAPGDIKKKGGKVKAKSTSSYKSGGSVSSASKRGDGCAQRGKTKGRMV